MSHLKAGKMANQKNKDFFFRQSAQPEKPTTFKSHIPTNPESGASSNMSKS